MSKQIPESKILISGTMRGGSSLVSNMLNAHSKVLVVGEFVHFFRFLYRRKTPLTKSSLSKLLEEMRIRLHYRFDLPFDTSVVYEDVVASGVSYQNLYNAILRQFLKLTGKVIAGEDAALNWTTIPEYLRLFPEGKVIQIIRDPRSVLASWHKASYQKVGYLDAIFNSMDNMDKCKHYQSDLSADNYMYIKYEDVVREPLVAAHKLCNFLSIEYESMMTTPNEWDSIFDGTYVTRGWSSHTGSMRNKGFDLSRLDGWKDNLEDWELCLCEYLLSERLEEFGYELSQKSFSPSQIVKGLGAMRSHPFLSNRYMKWVITNEGGEGYLDDPTDPYSWGIPGKNLLRFASTTKGQAYLNELSVLRESYDSAEN